MNQTSNFIDDLINEQGYQLSPVAVKLLVAVASELGNPDGFTARHRLNQKCPSFPLNHRTLANRDSLGTGPKEKILVGKQVFYRNYAILEALCRELSR
jgi:hypothetical protein